MQVVGMSNKSDRSYFVDLILVAFLGMFGAHEWYAGNKVKAFFKTITLNWFLIGWALDFFMVLLMQHKDIHGLTVKA